MTGKDVSYLFSLSFNLEATGWGLLFPYLMTSKLMYGFCKTKLVNLNPNPLNIPNLLNITHASKYYYISLTMEGSLCLEDDLYFEQLIVLDSFSFCFSSFSLVSFDLIFLSKLILIKIIGVGYVSLAVSSQTNTKMHHMTWIA